MSTIALLAILLTSHDTDASAKCKVTEKVKLFLILTILN